ncbi:tRNA lysidine(34) synthetase TilS [Larkinella rosea]|uniref:tRNA(Ile)-lysidine synthase n=1 Tax=Larkinella rosea TaxID=2025312 RepID=A0A3P1C378_9BACT|nr:tRNA lysidine(34) synthetase TilS [Larkinella rosea]RRB07513.1 tRNA lysidine(34) synthetase TilS [Larkinella rosea]
MAFTQNQAIEHQFLSFFKREQLFRQTDCILLAISGGLDSVVLAELFRLTGLQYGIAHVNFQLRGADSEEDEYFVKALAERHQVRFHGIRLPPEQYAEERGISTQMAARQLRYDWFDQLATEFGYQKIATAHHQDDVLETILLNLVRGTGLTGLRGIPVRQGRMVRPLWFSNRQEIEAYALAQGLNWREDSSNASDKYRRNQLRHQVIPVLKELNPNLLQTLQATVQRLQSADVLLDQEMERSWQETAEIRPNGIFLPIQTLLTQREWRFRLAEWLKPYGFQYVQIGPIAEAVQSSGFGQTFQSATHRILRDRAFLVIERLQMNASQSAVIAGLPAERVPISNQYQLRFELMKKPADVQFPSNPRTVYLDANLIQWPLTIRPWQNGDHFSPLGMKGKQTIGNFLTNNKVSRIDRRSAQVMVSENQIVWLIGYRLDHAFRVTDQTTQILKIEQLKFE